MPTRAKQANAVQAERLSPQAPQNGDAIVRTHGNNNRETLAEMTSVNDCKLLITKHLSEYHIQLALLNLVILKDLADLLG
jgi:hypothetical protein